jgi:two-component system sensor histidine kinase KdpD
VSVLGALIVKAQGLAALRRVITDVETRRVPGATLADGALLERAIANLVGNAVKHTDSPVTVTVSALGTQVEIRVIDRGPGIPAADRDQVFLPFQRLGDRDNTAGVGLGLALARGLVEAMDGTLTPEDTPGGGVTMVVSLPAARTAPVPVSAEDEELLA